MTLPLLAYDPSSQNHRVNGYEVPGDEQSGIFSLDQPCSTLEVDVLDMDALISAAYRQIFHEQQMLKSNRQTLLESQLRGGLISVKDFVRGLATSDAFRTWNYEVNNNYRFAELCVQRLLGRNVYDDKETLAWSIVLATKGVEGLVDGLIGSDEYMTNFGDRTVPYQRRRVLPQHALGDLPFERSPRYTQDHLTTLESLGYDFSADRRLVEGDWMEIPDVVRKAAGVVTVGLAIGLSLVAIATVLSWFGWISL